MVTCFILRKNKVRWPLCSWAATKFTSAFSPWRLLSVQANICTTALCWLETELRSGVLFFLLANLNRSGGIELNSSPSHLTTMYSKPKFLKATFFFFSEGQLGALMATVILKPVHPTLRTRGYKRH